ncbi:GNAT family N-acetyltransferase [Janthinobacterium sp. GW458P]|uniref:GNAT family N-acetyltransferase n=1 Tax=Janthinobacterium sp. GW458P TaxID=1981504 RepID=UPI000A329DE9|nr:GNAT family N-acetyltransferase [Janthinobacterium sp. GW458P]MBE3025128.1 GNAT family N-acetyltransferase [Janthinobacterium sp. GW458P]PHV16698.1 N-acetyltransferase [Janthinobacterium sp. BJB303]
MNYTLQHLEDKEAFQASFDLMRGLRPHIANPAAYVAQLVRQSEQGYRLLAAWAGEHMVGLAGYRALENLLYGRFIYVDDLVVSSDLQRSGLGARLLTAVREEAMQRSCDHFVLDTGLHMPLAQRFYFRQGLLARGMHFTQSLRPESLA